MTELGQIVAGALVLGVPSAFVIALGACARLGSLRDRWPLFAFAVVVVLVGVAASSTSDPDVARGEVLQGILLAALGSTALPLAMYYTLGRLVGNRAILAGAWLLSLAPLGFWLFTTWIGTLALTACPPDAYECPL